MKQPASGHQARNVVLLGIGHTNAHIVKQWAHAPIPNCKLICISKFPSATYSGMLPGTLGRQYREDEMQIDLQALADRAGAELILADVSGLDLRAGELHFSDRAPICFDALSIGVGSMPVGWQQHAQSPLLVPIKPMQSFLARLNKHLQSAKAVDGQPLRVAIVGGGVAGVEIACCLQEKFRKERTGSDLPAEDSDGSWGMRDSAQRSDRGISGELAIEIFTSSERIADGMTGRSIQRLEKLLARRGIVVHTGQRVTEVGETGLVTADGQRRASDCVIWAAAPPVLGKLGLESDDRGFIATSQTLQSLSDPRIFAVGDSGTVLACPAPKAGVYAVRQCPILWHNLRALLQNQTLKTFDPQSDFLKILNTGDGRALLQYGWFTAHARWCLWLKTWIDRRFVHEFQSPVPHHSQATTR